jgi:uncharacterized protein YodC (DUF2158 family)
LKIFKKTLSIQRLHLLYKVLIMSELKFSVGDSVFLKSGGPKMTVTKISRDRLSNIIIHTQWFVGQKVNSTSADQNAFTTEDPNPKKEISEKK